MWCWWEHGTFFDALPQFHVIFKRCCIVPNNEQPECTGPNVNRNKSSGEKKVQKIRNHIYKRQWPKKRRRNKHHPFDVILKTNNSNISQIYLEVLVLRCILICAIYFDASMHGLEPPSSPSPPTQSQSLCAYTTLGFVPFRSWPDMLLGPLNSLIQQENYVIILAVRWTATRIRFEFFFLFK